LLQVWPDWSVYTWQWRAIYLSVMCGAGVATYFLVLLLTGLRTRHLRLQL